MRTGQPPSSHGRSPRSKTRVAAALDGLPGQPVDLGGVVVAGAVPGEQGWVSVSASAGLPSRARRCLIALAALSAVSPERRAGLASDAECSVRNVARSASVPR